MTNKTEITIEGDNIIYNGVKYQKVQEEPKKNTPNLTDIIFEALESTLASYEDYSEVYDKSHHISEVLVDVMSEHIPDYSDWEDAMDEIGYKILSQNYQRMFQLGWNAYCKKMWDMINEDS
jgi:hypothetical protein